MVYLKEKAEKYLFVRCVVPTICGEGLGCNMSLQLHLLELCQSKLLIVMILSQAMFKTVYEIIIYPINKNNYQFY